MFDAINEKKVLDVFSDVVTQSDMMYYVFKLIEIFANTEDTVLLTGETGTGKDLIARKIFELSRRSEYSFVSVNLASISPTLFESELFGSVKGSYTGSTGDKTGYFESANGGTLFLDEIGELPIALQGKLLRVIQYGELYKIGSVKPIKLNVRIIAATNKNLIKAIERGDFRADLYYRLTRCQIDLPPLRERIMDIIPLIKHFIKKGNEMYQRNIIGCTSEVESLLLRYDFPGNIRELENVVLNAVATCEGNIITELKLPKAKPSLIYNENNSTAMLKTLNDATDDYILHVYHAVNSSTEVAAKVLEISLRTMQRRLKDIKTKRLKKLEGLA